MNRPKMNRGIQMQILLITTRWLNCPLLLHERHMNETVFTGPRATFETAATDKFLVCHRQADWHRQKHGPRDLRGAWSHEAQRHQSTCSSGLIISLIATCSRCVMLHSNLTNALTLEKVTNRKMSCYVFNYISYHYMSPPHDADYRRFCVNCDIVMVWTRRKIWNLEQCSEYIYPKCVANTPINVKGSSPFLS
jgi:hypothetical protein